MSTANKYVVITLSVIALVSIVYLVYSYNVRNMQEQSQSHSLSNFSANDMRSPMYANIENFEHETGHTEAQQQQNVVDASENIENIEQPLGVNVQNDNTITNLSQLPSECYPKDVLSSADLLPRDANSLWAQVSPSGQGSLADQNFLTSGFHIGINTVGQSLRNANRQFRSEPLNPQVKVSPWQQSTIEPDINRRPLEIQGDL